MNRYDDSHVINELYQNMYVDNWLSGAESEPDAQHLFSCAIDIMSEAGMTLTKWTSNNNSIADMVKSHFGDNIYLDNSSVKILGMKWLSHKDCFIFEGLHIPSDVPLLKY